MGTHAEVPYRCHCGHQFCYACGTRWTSRKCVQGCRLYPLPPETPAEPVKAPAFIDWAAFFRAIYSFMKRTFFCVIYSFALALLALITSVVVVAFLENLKRVATDYIL